MKVLFVHQNFPGQYVHLARRLAADPANQVVFITQRSGVDLPGVRRITYKPSRAPTAGVHHYLREAEGAILNAQEVARVAMQLKESGFVPDLMLGHNGWGEIWYLKDVFPHVPLLGYFEFFYKPSDADVGFDPEEAVTIDTRLRIRTKNVGNYLGLGAADWGQCPTSWQRSLFPLRYQSTLSVVHEGVDTDLVLPDPRACLSLPELPVPLTQADETITYVARNLEPYRGFPNFMRALAKILCERPHARALIVGADGVSYGAQLPENETYRKRILAELGDSIDLSRVHFLGRVPYSTFIRVLQVSRVHVYLTYPFVLSWSVLEAMSAGCLVVASRTPPVAEVISHERNGLLVEFHDTDAIASTVIAALEEPDRFSHLRSGARSMIRERYDLTRVCLPAQFGLMQSMLR